MLGVLPSADVVSELDRWSVRLKALEELGDRSAGELEEQQHVLLALTAAAHKAQHDSDTLKAQASQHDNLARQLEETVKRLQELEARTSVIGGAPTIASAARDLAANVAVAEVAAQPQPQQPFIPRALSGWLGEAKQLPAPAAAPAPVSAAALDSADGSLERLRVRRLVPHVLCGACTMGVHASTPCERAPRSQCKHAGILKHSCRHIQALMSTDAGKCKH